MSSLPIALTPAPPKRKSVFLSIFSRLASPSYHPPSDQCQLAPSLIEVHMPPATLLYSTCGDSIRFRSFSFPHVLSLIVTYARVSCTYRHLHSLDSAYVHLWLHRVGIILYIEHLFSCSSPCRHKCTGLFKASSAGASSPAALSTSLQSPV
ncbi:uncharacterized protein LAESUDRAFT_496761 [Laetiporus sulphureus 93-53]|uniref:Uncharacterized protein n=1 Tax=Laetiporus sulphureus 93-53 TaxID=1314785 RepID=A0A165BGZ1_9APHY|nr:uncharacterized protein LAESUDRAFT_496761 [Laetiporus sulphureus 93-53]KZT01035.1 hypothetical protein LAESUDRAFT_496761 [Laetiporus sulphureus 93-53]